MIVLSIFKGEITLPDHKPTMREIAELVAERHGLTTAELKKDSRRRRYCHPRQEAMALTYQTGLFSNAQIARFYGVSDHTTVIHARNAHAKRLAGAAGP